MYEGIKVCRWYLAQAKFRGSLYFFREHMPQYTKVKVGKSIIFHDDLCRYAICISGLLMMIVMVNVW